MHQHMRSFLLLLVVALATSIVPSSGEAQLETCTIDANGEETCQDSSNKANANDSGATSKEFCLPTGVCYESLEAASTMLTSSLEYLVNLDKPVSFGEAQQVSGERSLETLQVLADTYKYMVQVYQNETTKPFREGCQCRDKLCSFWAAIGT
jgi:hypothetical protein